MAGTTVPTKVVDTIAQMTSKVHLVHKATLANLRIAASKVAPNLYPLPQHKVQERMPKEIRTTRKNVPAFAKTKTTTLDFLLNMKITATLIPGDGIGPEITEAVVKIFEAAAAPINWEEHNAGETVLATKGALIPDSLIDSIKQHKIALKGPCSTPVGKGFKSVNVTLRQKLDLYANVRPGRSIEGVKTRFDNVDLVTFRENTEGLYAGLEVYDENLEVADAFNRISRSGSERLVRAAFEYARKHGRKKSDPRSQSQYPKTHLGIVPQNGASRSRRISRHRVR